MRASRITEAELGFCAMSQHSPRGLRIEGEGRNQAVLELGQLGYVICTTEACAIGCDKGLLPTRNHPNKLAPRSVEAPQTAVTRHRF